MNVVVQIVLLIGVIANGLVISGMRPAFLLPTYAVIALAGLLAWSPKRHLGLSPRVIPCLAVATFFFGYILLRIVFSPVEYIARADLLMVLAALIVYLVTVLCATSPAARIALVSVLLIFACAQVLVGAIQFSKGDNFMPFAFLPRGDYLARASGFFGCPNHLAGFLQVAMLMALSLTFWSRWRLLGKITVGYVAVVCAAGLLMSGSRGGYVSAAVGLFVFAVISLALARNWMWREIWLFLVTVLVFAAIGGCALVYFTVRKSDFLTHRVGAAGVDLPLRVDLAKAALKQFQTSPLVGTGSATYLYYGRLYREPSVQLDPVYTHSDFLQLLAEYGLIAGLGIAAFLVVHIRNGWRFIADVIARRTIEGERDAPGFHGDHSLALTTGALSSLAALTAHSLVDFNFHVPTNTLVIAFVLGMLANPFSVLSSLGKSQSAIARRFLRAIPVAMPALGLWLGFIAITKWPAARLADRAQVLLSDWRFLLEPAVAGEAATLAERSLELDPRNPAMYLAIGDSYVALAEMEESDPAARQSWYEKAIATYLRGHEIAPDDVHMVFGAATALDEIRRFDEAAPLYRRAIEMDGNSATVRWAYGNHLHLQGKLDEAEAEYQRSTRLATVLAAYEGLDRLKKERAAPPEPTAR